MKFVSICFLRSGASVHITVFNPIFDAHVSSWL
jgi:hypothetical protein